MQRDVERIFGTRRSIDVTSSMGVYILFVLCVWHTGSGINLLVIRSGPKHLNTVKELSTKHQGCLQLILCSVDFLLLVHYLSDCASIIV